MDNAGAKHTPGPWVQPMRYSPEDGCDIPCGAIEDADGRSITVCTYDQEPTISAANARLIAAAPDLLAACKAVSEWHQHSVGCPASEIGAIGDSGCDCGLAAVRAAIAKAEGGAS